MPTPRTRLFLLVAAAVPLALASGCPQLASDDFTKADEPFDSEGNGAGGSDDGGANDTSPNVDITNSTQASSDGNESTTSTSQGGTDAGSDDTTSSADTSGGAGGTSGSGGTGGDTVSSGGSASTETTASSGGSTSDTSGTGGTGGSSTDGEATSSGCVAEEEVCDGLDNDCEDGIDEDYVCDNTSYGCQGFAFGGHGYMYCARPASQDDAMVLCEGQGMTLVQIDSAPENDELVAQASSGWSGNDGTGGSGSSTTWGGGTRTTGGGEQQDAFWTGGTLIEADAEWIWSGSETPFWEGDAEGNAVDGAYTNWGDGRPNGANDDGENCMAVYVADGSDGDMGTWNDLTCVDSYPFICESPASD